jgi:hypothetical protein
MTSVLVAFAAGFAACVALALVLLKFGAAAKQKHDRERFARHKDSPWLPGAKRYSDQSPPIADLGAVQAVAFTRTRVEVTSP